MSETAAVWLKRVEAWARSGLTCTAFAEKIGVNPHTLAGWRWKLRARGTNQAMIRAEKTTELSDGCGLVDVTTQVAAALAAQAGVIEVEVGGVLVRLRGQVDDEMLTRVLSAVGVCR